MVGILVHGNNHFILSGPAPDEATALALVWRWSVIQIGEAKSSSFGQWQIRSKEFENSLPTVSAVSRSGLRLHRSWKHGTRVKGSVSLCSCRCRPQAISSSKPQSQRG